MNDRRYSTARWQRLRRIVLAHYGHVCKYGDGSRVAADNRRQTIEELRVLVEEQQQQIARMAEQLARYEDPQGWH
jgi:hypothetical protein